MFSILSNIFRFLHNLLHLLEPNLETPWLYCNCSNTTGDSWGQRERWMQQDAVKGISNKVVQPRGRISGRRCRRREDVWTTRIGGIKESKRCTSLSQRYFCATHLISLGLTTSIAFLICRSVILWPLVTSCHPISSAMAVVPSSLQWVKKLSQCLIVSERMI